MSKRVLIVGCGQLGSRHLQAIASLPEVQEVHIVDPVPSALGLGQQRLKEVPNINNGIRYFWHSSYDNLPHQGDLCIVATQSQGRPVIIRKIANQGGWKKLLIEKVVAQSIGEYLELIALCKEQQISVWVNCKTRAYKIHRYIKSKLKKEEPFFFSRVGGNHGLGNNGIHTADLFCFYSDTKKIQLRSIRINPFIHPSKRGNGIYDLSGHLYGTSDRGDDFVLSFAANHDSPDVITIVSPSGRFFIDHFQKLAMESYADSKWQWRPLKIEEDWMVSHMTKTFALEIMTQSSCALPTLEQCWPAHEFILNALKPHFSQLLQKELDYCPIT